MIPGAVGLLGFVCVCGGVMDYVSVSKQRAELQSIADSAALSAVREMSISPDNKQRIEFVASAHVAALAGDPNVRPDAVADLEARRLTVSVTAPVNARFPGPFSSMGTQSVTSAAELLGQPGNVCLIGLSNGVNRTIAMNNRSRLTAASCGIYSNSTDKQSMYVNNTADIVAEQIYLSGGFQGKPTGTLSEPITDAPPIPDPLGGRPRPSVADDACDYTDYVVTGSEDLSAGVYCGGLTVDGGDASLFAGEYVIRDGPLKVTGGGTLSGDFVGFYLTGRGARLQFDVDSTVDLVGPKSGEMTGLLFWADPANAGQGDKEHGHKDHPHNDDADDDGHHHKEDQTFQAGRRSAGFHVISSDDARRLEGTIYLPDRLLVVDGDKPVADRSNYTVIVALGFELNNGPNLVLKTDYGLSDVPVPAGVGPMKNVDGRLVH